MKSLVTPNHATAANQVRQMLATYNEAQDLIEIGAYQAGSNATVDAAISLHQPIKQMLTQSVDEPASFLTTVQQLEQLVQPPKMM
jgi:flagellum-specific ATP synthase